MMHFQSNIKNLRAKISNLSYGLFLLGIFLLPSAFSIGSFLILITVIIDLFGIKKNFLNDNWNISFLFCLFFLILTTILNIIFANQIQNNTDINWPSIFNLAPFFLSFWTFQKHLKTQYQRVRFCKVLIAGTFPVIFSALAQYFLGWYGPMTYLGGLIVWYQKPLEEMSGVTGLFNNPNYLASWLSMVFPFCLYLFIDKKKRDPIFSKILFLFLIFLISFLLISTNSRAAILSIIISLTFLIFNNFLLIFTLGTISFSIFILINFSSGISEFITYFLSRIIDGRLINKFLISDISNISEWPRFLIWRKSLFSIFEKPLMGYGPGSTESVLSKDNLLNNLNIYTHSHNLYLEVALNYGLILSTVLFITLITLLVKSFNKLFVLSAKESNYFINHGWFISALIALCINLADVTYYDGRISILFWILFSGLKCILDEHKQTIKEIV